MEKPETSHKVLPMALQVSITQTRRPSAVSPFVGATRVTHKQLNKPAANHFLMIQPFRRKSAITVEKASTNNL